MTFDEWYATQKHQLSNEQVCRVIWEAATRAENEACAKVAEQMPPVRVTRWSGQEGCRPATRREIAEAIRARMKS